MSLSNFNRLPIEYITLDAATPLMLILLGFIQIFVCAILGWDNKIYGYLLGPRSSFVQKDEQRSNQKLKEKKTMDNNDKEMCLYRGDIEIVFKRLGSFSSSSSDSEFQKILDSDDVEDMMVTAATEEEVKAAFDVFDENKDGFIDEFELQRVLYDLGFQEGPLEIDNCRKMIVLADNNGDGMLDFTEFVTFLQNSS